jgi:hypothetical protein
MESSIPFKDLSIDLPEKSTGGMSVCLIGSTRSGKTTLTKHLLRNQFKSHVGVLMSPSIHAHTYDDIHKRVIKAPDYYPEIVKEMFTINRKCENHYQFLAILDDCVTAKFNKELLKLFTIYRNSGISGIMSIQSPILLNSAMRGNLNVVMLGYMNSDESCEKVIRMFCYASIPGKNIEAKIQEYKRLTADHHWLVLNNLTGEFYRTKLHL